MNIIMAFLLGAGMLMNLLNLLIVIGYRSIIEKKDNEIKRLKIELMKTKGERVE